MPEVIELRVHGVGGADPEGLLGEGGPADVVQVGGDGLSSFQARRRDRRVEGYVWGKLTSRVLLQPFWLLLLPFTLVNVAGWMHRPARTRRERAALAASRLVLEGLGIALTVAYVFWIANLLITRAAGLDAVLGMETDRAKIMAAGAALSMFVVAVLVTARSVQKGFEGFEGPVHPNEEPDGTQGVLGAMAQAPATMATVVRSVTRADGLRDERFWAHAGEARALLYLHVVAAFGAVAGVVAWAWVRAEDPEGLRLATFATYTTEALLWGVLVLAVIHLVGWRRPFAGGEFRWLGPAAAAGTGIGLGTGFFHGLTWWLLGDPARVAALGTAFGMAAVAVGVGGLALGGWLAHRAHREEARARTEGAPEQVRPNRSERARELTGATDGMYRLIGWRRALSEAGRNGDLVLTFVQAVFVAAALVQLRTGRLTETWSVVAAVGNAGAAAAAAGILFFLIRRSFRPNQRRVVGILWDVLTFWPRRFHPLAVRPYAERAVPELQHRLWHHVKERGRRVILSTHSQGTVVGYAALAQLPDAITSEVALVTYGSPLRQLYAMAFPAYFDPRQFLELRERLFHDGREPSPAWRNLYRRTDYIGKTVFDDPALDIAVPDPAEEPEVSPLPLAEPLRVWPDPPRTAWVDFFAHSFYNREPALRSWVEDLRARMP